MNRKRQKRHAKPKKPGLRWGRIGWLSALIVGCAGVLLAITWPRKNTGEVTNAAQPESSSLPASSLQTASEQELAELLRIPSSTSLNAGSAVVAFDQSLSALDTALTALQRDLPDDAQAQHLYGVAQMRLKRTQLAEPALKLAVEKAPKDWQMRIDLADLLMQLGRNAEALELLKLKTTDSPAPSSWLELLAECQQRAGELDAAQLSLMNLLKSDEHHTQARLKLAELQLQLGQAIEAESNARKVLDADGKIAGAWQVLGRSLALQKKVTESREALAQWQTLTASAKAEETRADFETRLALDTQRVHSSIFRSLAQLHQAKGKLPQAETMYARALEINPTDTVCLAGWAALARRSGDYQRAIELNRRLLGLEPRQIAHYQNLANLSMELNQPADAEATLRLACIRMPDHGPSHLLLARFLSLVGKPHEALLPARRAQELLKDRTSAELLSQLQSVTSGP